MVRVYHLIRLWFGISCIGSMSWEHQSLCVYELLNSIRSIWVMLYGLEALVTRLRVKTLQSEVIVNMKAFSLFLLQ